MPIPYFDSSHIDWNLIRVFLAVVDHGSLTRAAEMLSLSQPTLSRQISELEQALGTALFERVARGLKLTGAGENLIEPARHMMAAARALGMAVTSQDQAMSGTVRITASEMVSAFVLPAILAKLAQSAPEIQIELVASNQISNLLEREADIAIRMVRPTQTALIARHIADWPIGFYVHKSYLARLEEVDVGTKVEKSANAADALQLGRYRWLGYDQSEELIDGFRAVGMEVDRTFFAFRSDNHLVNWHAMQSGLGIWSAMKWLAEKNPDLVNIPTEHTLPVLPVWLTSHRELKSSKRIRSVFDFLALELAKVDSARTV